MKGKKLFKALSFIHPKYIQEAEFDTVSQPRKAGFSHRRLLTLILAACLVFALAVSAYAANLFGIRELFRTQSRELPEAAETYIQPETVKETAQAGWSCEITESLADNANVMVTVAVHGGDKYIIAPTYVSAADSVSEIGLSGNQTLGEYAAEKGKTLLFVGASITKIGDTEGINGSQRMQSLADNEMVILSATEQTVNTENPDAVCTVYALEDGKEDVQRVELPFTLNAAPGVGEEIVYHPEDPEAIPGMTVGDMTVTQTALGCNIRIPETVTDQEKYYEIMKVTIDGITYGDGAGSVIQGDETWFEARMCQGTLGDELIVRYFDWESQPMGEIRFHK